MAIWCKSPGPHLKSQNHCSQGERDVAQALCNPERIPGPCTAEVKCFTACVTLALIQPTFRARFMLLQDRAVVCVKFACDGQSAQ